MTSQQGHAVRPGSIVSVTYRDLEWPPQSGYLQAPLGTLVEVLYDGDTDDSVDWLYGRCICDDKRRGWFRADSVRQALKQGTATMAVDALAEGYLSLESGDKVVIMYEGCDATDSVGWLYGHKDVGTDPPWSSSLEWGWFPAAHISMAPIVASDLPRAAPTEQRLPHFAPPSLPCPADDSANSQAPPAQPTFGAEGVCDKRSSATQVAETSAPIVTSAVPRVSKTKQGFPHCAPPSRPCPADDSADLSAQSAQPFFGAEGVYDKSLASLPPQPPLLGDIARASSLAAGWTYPLRDEHRRCFAGHFSSGLGDRQLKSLLRLIMDGTDWDSPMSQMGQMARKTAWLVQHGCWCSYAYGGVRVKPEWFPPWMEEAMELCMPLCGLQDRSLWPNSCNVNVYADGTDGIGWHADNEALFAGMEEDCRIISFSLGQERTFELRLKESCGGSGSAFPEHKLRLKSGDLCTMEGMTQKFYEHRVPKGGRSLRLRVNLTWRWIRHHDKHCGLPRGR